MTAALLHARTILRARWRSWLALTLLVALAGGAVIALAAGARRTDTAYPRLLRWAKAHDGLMILGAYGTTGISLRQIEQIPEVASVATALVPTQTAPDFTLIALTDPHVGRDVDRFKLLAGRPPRGPDEVMLSFPLAGRRHLRVGDSLPVPLPAPSGPAAAGVAPAPVVRLRVVGIEASPSDFPPKPAFSGPDGAFVAPAFLATPAGRRLQQPGTAELLVVRLRGGLAATPAFEDDLARRSNGNLGFGAQADQTAGVRRSQHLQAVALWLMAGIAGLAAVLILLQLLARQLADDASDDPTLRTLGMTTAGLVGSGMVRMALAAVGGAAGAVLVAWLLSPLFPLGTPRVAEPTPGMAFNLTILGIGAAVVVGGVAALGAATMWRFARRTGFADDRRPVRSSPLSAALLRTPLPIAVTTGARFAFQPATARGAVPVRATVAAVAIGVGTMTCAVGFGASLAHLLATPALYGVTFGADVQPPGNGTDVRTLVPAIRADPDVASVAAGYEGVPLQSGHVTFGGMSVLGSDDWLAPTVIDGRLPAGPDEILLGTTTMRELHTSVGRTVPVAASGLTGPRPMRVVGRGVLAPLQDTLQLGRGAVVEPSALAAFAAMTHGAFQLPPPGDAFVQFRPGVAPARALPELRRRLGGGSGALVVVPTQPADVVNFGQVRDLPQLLAGLLGVLAAVTMVYLLTTAVRRRRRDLAVLKTLGFIPRQVSAAVASQATSLVLIASAVGVPLGIAGGRAAWAAVAGSIGVVVQPATPWLWVVAVVPVALVVANLVALVPALAAGRVTPAVALRVE